ncbi:MAG TPA: hypothetical protein VHM91_13180 [Verrucomicrobiales bacterium]|nr:hypothetical protein [Verrucomicrobiales bacterium]
MPAPDCRQWIDELWPLVCSRAMRPLAGVLLSRQAAAVVAEEVFSEFLTRFPRQPGSWETVHHWLISRVRPLALSTAAEERRRLGDWQAFRDPHKTSWGQNPDFDALRHRSIEGALLSREWDIAAAILERAAQPPLLRLGIAEEDARDIQMETMAELTRASKTAGTLEKLHVFEELPKLFATMIERRAISWLRKVSAQKRRPVHPAFTDRLDDPDNPAARHLADPRTNSSGEPPWVNAGFDRIRTACRDALTGFEWHLVEVLFVEASHSRQDLVEDPWILEQLGVSPAASESKRRRRLNLFIDEALARLGRTLETCDL